MRAVDLKLIRVLGRGSRLFLADFDLVSRPTVNIGSYGVNDKDRSVGLDTRWMDSEGKFQDSNGLASLEPFMKTMIVDGALAQSRMAQHL